VFTLPNGPSPQADIHELADFAELLCWENGTVSAREIVAYLGRVDDNDHNVGCNDDDDENANSLDDVMNEIDRRAKACETGYPFDLELEGTTLRYQAAKEDDHRSVIYRYLLLSTRLNMKVNHVHGDLDATELLEELSAHVLKNYLGASKARSLVFGTSIGGRFQTRVDEMCRNLCEGGGFRSLDEAPVKAKDDKLDAVAWVPFTDRMPGQLIIFGQCKTGSNWGGLTDQLQPENFVKKWMKEPILVDPVRAFCVAEAADRSQWKGTTVSTGILFDRCRLVDFSDDVGQDLMSRILRWTRAAKKSVQVVKSTAARGNKKSKKKKSKKKTTRKKKR